MRAAARARTPVLRGERPPVLGIDFLERPIREASRKAQERGWTPSSSRSDALTLRASTGEFDAVIDSGLSTSSATRTGFATSPGWPM